MGSRLEINQTSSSRKLQVGGPTLTNSTYLYRLDLHQFAYEAAYIFYIHNSTSNDTATVRVGCEQAFVPHLSSNVREPVPNLPSGASEPLWLITN